jgi:hypothetical protein
MDAAIRRILYATPIRSLQDDPILTRKKVQTLTEEDLRKQDLIKQSSRGL